MRGFHVERLGSTSRGREELNRVCGQQEADEAAPLSDTRPPVPDQVAFNIDFVIIYETDATVAQQPVGSWTGLSSG